jgi:hypothetical protein
MASTDLTKEHVESLVVPLHRDPLQKDATRLFARRRPGNSQGALKLGSLD